MKFMDKLNIAIELETILAKRTEFRNIEVETTEHATLYFLKFNNKWRFNRKIISKTERMRVFNLIILLFEKKGYNVSNLEYKNYQTAGHIIYIHLNKEGE